MAENAFFSLLNDDGGFSGTGRGDGDETGARLEKSENGDGSKTETLGAELVLWALPCCPQVQLQLQPVLMLLVVVSLLQGLW